MRRRADQGNSGWKVPCIRMDAGASEAQSGQRSRAADGAHSREGIRRGGSISSMPPVKAVPASGIQAAASVSLPGGKVRNGEAAPEDSRARMSGSCVRDGPYPVQVQRPRVWRLWTEKPDGCHLADT